MNGRRIYLDHHAGAPLGDEARAAMAAALARTDVGNPSSIHHEGRVARALIERARGEVAALLAVDRARLVFTSGGAEADVLGIAASHARAGGGRLVLSRTEHPAAIGAAERLAERGAEVVWCPVDGDGRWLPAALPAATWRQAAVAMSAVNHETGVVQPFEQVLELLGGQGALHLDAVQAVGKLDLGLAMARAATVAVSAHKLGGPAGVGALVVGDGVEVVSQTGAGMQERGRRGGTENLLGVVGFGAAAAAAAQRQALGTWQEVAALGHRLEDGLVALGATVAGRGAPRVGGVTNARFDDVPGDALVMALDLAGVAASTGAACSSGTSRPSAVLLASGVPELEARGAVRLSLGWSTSAADVDVTLALLPTLLRQIRAAADV
jgi:cysteine desulfurase